MPDAAPRSGLNRCLAKFPCAAIKMSEIRALLLTDVVDSTQLAERLGDAAAAELGAAHDRVARDLLRTWRGREIDKTDGMLMLFDAATDAIGFVTAYHGALAALPVPLKARAGLHVGPVILRANPPEDVAHGAKPLEVEGIAKPIAARVMSLALGGQTLLTAEAREALGRTDLRVQSHGHWRIKGISDPVELYETGDAGAPFTPPPDSSKVYRVVQLGELWLPMRQVRHSLPAERDAFVGRQDALTELAQRFDAGARLVSVLGIGGTGKTRLALRFAWTWLGDFPGGAWFCDLSAARNIDGIVHAVAQGLDVPLGLGDPMVQLGHAIAGRGRCLVILDNFEQITRHAEDTLGRWLDRAAEARFLVTTREVLGLPGEEALALAPLGLPDAQALFSRRATSAKRDYQPSAEDRAAIPQLVRLLDGLPLAIELAAARVRVMPPRMLLSRMGQRFKLLVAAGGRQDRQATLRAAFDWSWELLSEAEKAALAQLSVFEGGFTLEAAEAVLELSVGEGAGAVASEAVDVLQSLVDKSFVRPLADARFDLLGSVQEYAAEHLCTPGRYPGSGLPAQRAAHDRHGAHFAHLAEPHSDAGIGGDIDNLVAACRRATLNGASEMALATLEGAWSVLELRGPFSTGIELALAVARMPTLGVAARARVSYVAGIALDVSGRIGEAQQHLQDALVGARKASEPRLEAQALVGLGELHARQAQLEDAKAHHAEALSLARTLGDRSLECGALNGLGSACVDLGRMDEARLHYTAALHTARAAGDRQWECSLLGNLGGLYFNQGQSEEAAKHFQASLVVARELGKRGLEGSALCNLGALHHAQGHLQEALAELEAALEVTRAMGHIRLECVVQCNLGMVRFGLQHWKQAHTHYDAALSIARELNDRRSEGLFLGYLGQLQARLGRFEQARANLGAGERLLLQVVDQFSLGLLLCHRVEVEQLAGDFDAARAAWSDACRIEAKVDAGSESELGVALKRAGALLRDVPGAQALP
jgi:predicted ATPase/class 3 adenylate cyclase/Tfp pilus assembly protein PilF